MFSTVRGKECGSTTKSKKDIGVSAIGKRKNNNLQNTHTKKSFLVHNKVDALTFTKDKRRNIQASYCGEYTLVKVSLAFLLKERCSLTWLPSEEPSSGIRAQTYQVTQRFSPQQFVQQ